MIKAVLFDYGGTLVTLPDGDIMGMVSEGAKLGHAYLRDTFDEVPPFPAFFGTASQILQSAYMRTMGTSQELDAEAAVREIVKALGLELSDEQFGNFAREWYKPFAGRMNLREGASECLEELKKRGLKLAVVSNTIWPQRFFEEALDGFGISGFFESVVTSSGHGTKKPYAPIFEDTLSGLGVSEGEAVFVGDSFKEDIAGAAMVGMKTVYLDWKGEVMPGVEPDATIKSLTELCAVLDNLKG